MGFEFNLNQIANIVILISAFIIAVKNIYAFLKKPVVYSQFDKEQFFSGEHSYTKGYFSYEDNGFGPVCYDIDTTVEEMIKVIENDCANTEKYISRIEEFYEYFDENSCQRVYEAIRKL